MLQPASARQFVRVVCATVIASALPAQSPAVRPSSAPWTLLNAIGYGGAGLGLGTLIALRSHDDGGFLDLSDELTIMAGTTLLGLISGGYNGHVVRRAVAERRPIGTGRKIATSIGGVLAGASVGALLAVPLVGQSNESGTALGSDAATVVATTAAGAGLATWYVMRHQPELRRSGVAMSPYRAPDGSHGLRVRVTF